MTADAQQGGRTAPTESSSPRPIIVGRVIYGTITLMSVLIVYDGWQNLRARDVVVVIVGPVLAMFLSHVFAATLARQIAIGRQVTGSERLAIVRSESRFLVLGAPPLALVAIFSLLGASLSDSIRYVVAAGALSLGYWGGVAGRRAGFTGWRLALAVVSGLVVGGLILALQAFLQPGAIASGGMV